MHVLCARCVALACVCECAEEVKVTVQEADEVDFSKIGLEETLKILKVNARARLSSCMHPLLCMHDSTAQLAGSVAELCLAPAAPCWADASASMLCLIRAL